MAYLDPTRLTCPECGFSAKVTMVVGVGPHSRRGDLPSRSYSDPGPFVEGRTDTGTALLTCPHDRAVVWVDRPARAAFGPLSADEMRRPLARAWLAPGTENPFAPDPRPPDPRDPFAPRPTPGGS